MEPLVYDPDRLKLLDAFLQALLATLQPSPEADAARRRVVAEMQAVVTEAMPKELHCSVETFGSFRAGLQLPGSDMDFAVTAWVYKTVRTHRGATFGDEQQPQQIVHEVHDWAPAEQQRLLVDLADALESRGLVQGQVELVLHARVPIIKCIHRETGLACDFSISRPECAFKAEMQKLLTSIDRRYAALYRLVKFWAAAHGLNDASSNTLNSWSWGLMVAYYLQCEQPAVLPPIWQLLERQMPTRYTPRILQVPGTNSAVLKRVLNQAAIGAGAYTSKRSRAGDQAVNHKSFAELLAGFFELFGEQMSRWVEGLDGSTRCSTWFGTWVHAAWPVSKPYIFGIEDPFHSEDNTARSVGTHNHLSCVNTARYIAWAVSTSAKLLRDALDGKPSETAAAKAAAAAGEGLPAPTPTAATAAAVAAATAALSGPGGASLTDCPGSTGSTGSTATTDDVGSTNAAPGIDSKGSTTSADHAGSTPAAGSTGSTACSDAVCQQMLAAVGWLFGPAVLQLQQLPADLQVSLQRQIPVADLEKLTAEITSFRDLPAALGNSSSLGCSDSKNSCLSNAAKVQQIQQAIQLYNNVMQKLHAASDLVVCMGDYQQLRKHQMKQRWDQQQQEQLQLGLNGLTVGSAPANLQPQQQQGRQQQQQRRGRGAPRQPQLQQLDSRETPAAVDLISAALRQDGAMRRQDSSSSVPRGDPRPRRPAIAAFRVHSAPASPPPSASAGFRGAFSKGLGGGGSRGFSGAPGGSGDGFTTEASRGFSRTGSSMQAPPPMPVTAGSHSSSGSRPHEGQDTGFTRQGAAGDSMSSKAPDCTSQAGSSMLSSAPATAGVVERARTSRTGRGRASVSSSSSEGPLQQQQDSSEGRQQRAARAPRGLAAIALSQAGLATGAAQHSAAVEAASVQPHQRGSDDGAGRRRSRRSSSELQQQFRG